MRWTLIAAGLLVSLGSSEAFAQANPYVTGASANPYVRAGRMDVLCTPPRFVYLNPRPMPPVYPPPYAYYPMPVPMPLAMSMPMPTGFPALTLPTQPPFVAGVNYEREPAPRRAPIYSTPVAPRTEPVPAKEADPEEEASRKLKLAQYLEQDGKADKARQRYEEIIQKYPNTAAAKEAKQILNQVASR